jgi:hypothetical protein
VDVYNLCRGFTVAGEYVDTGSGRSEERQISERLGIAYGTARNHVQESQGRLRFGSPVSGRRDSWT